MEKEETLNKEDQNLKDENSDLSKDKQASDAVSYTHLTLPTNTPV